MSIGNLFGRRIRLTVSIPTATPGDYQQTIQKVLTISGEGDPNSPGLRIRAKIVKTSEKVPNTAVFSITNLSPASRGLLQTVGARVIMEAGYEGTGLATYWIGDVRTCDQVRNKADWDTVLKMGDGERSFAFARLNQGWVPGTKAGVVLQALAKATGIGQGNLPDVLAQLSSTFQQGYAVSGKVSGALDQLLSSVGWEWSIQNNALQLIPPGYQFNGQIPLISPSTGLIGSPEMGTAEKPGKPALCKFKSMLTPTVPGRYVHLKSERYDQDVVVNKCEFDLDTAGGPWETTIYGILRKKAVAP